MARVMAVTFEQYGRLHYLNPGERDYTVGDLVLFPTESGPEVCQVVWAPEWVDSSALADLPDCPGPAGPEALARDKANRARRAEALAVAKTLIARHDLPMKVVGVDFVDRVPEFDQLIAIYFSAPGRVDFRVLLGDLARALRSRIDLRQIASRDVARITSGIGACGRELCCATFLTDFEPVGVRLAKAQGLPVNPLQISGACGRLMCCLKYEHPLYVEFFAAAPAVGSQVSTPHGDGLVVGQSVPGNSVTVRTRAGDLHTCPLASVCVTAAGRRARNHGVDVDPGRHGDAAADNDDVSGDPQDRSGPVVEGQ